MLLPLITPQGANFIKDFPAQNAVNLNAIDAYAGPCLTTHGLQSFSPGLLGSTTNPVLGTGGFSSARYYRIFDQVHMWGEFRFGTSGFSVGSGIYSLILPFTVNSVIGVGGSFGFSPVVGVGSVYDASLNAGRVPVTVHLKSTTEIMFGVRMGSGLGNREVRDSGYITWAASDGISWNARFQKVA